MYVSGGAKERYGDSIGSCEKYDEIPYKWQIVAEMREKRRNHGLTAAAGR